MEQFELNVQMPKTAPVVWNYETLKEELTAALADYQNRIYTEDTVAEAKTDRAKLNKLKKALSDERIERKKEFNKPFEAFEEQIKELCGIIDSVTSGIDTQLDTYEQKRITEKKAEIKTMFDELSSQFDSLSFITLDKIYNPKWENKSVNNKAIALEIASKFEQAGKDLEIISKLPSYAFEATEVYKKTLDISKAIAEGENMARIAEAKKQAEAEAQRRAEEARIRAEEEARRRAEAEALMSKATEVNLAPAAAEPTPVEPTYEFAFKVKITKSQAIELKDFCTAHGIELQRI